MGRILFTIHDAMNRANFSGTYTRVVDGKQVVVRKGWKKRRRSIAIAAGAIATTVGILALLAARKKSSRLPTVPVKPQAQLPGTPIRPQLPPAKPQPPSPPAPPAPPTKKTKKTKNNKTPETPKTPEPKAPEKPWWQQKVEKPPLNPNS